jgi:hypothetical protein
MMLHVPQQPLAQKLLDRGRLEFKWERFTKLQPELVPLFKRHWKEIALDRDIVPLDPDWDYYLAVDSRQLLHILTARAPNGKLAGYIFNIVGSHNHYKSTRFANTEMFYLHPYFRKGWQPVINFKLHFQDGRVGQFLSRLGYEPTDIVMRKKL